MSMSFMHACIRIRSMLAIIVQLHHNGCLAMGQKSVAVVERWLLYRDGMYVWNYATQ